MATAIEENWPFEQIRPSDGEAIVDLLIAFQSQIDDVDDTVETLEEQRDITTATNRELTKLAAEVNVTRETDESDERLRTRGKIAKAISSPTGTIYDLAQILTILFGDDVTKASLDTVGDEPVVQVTLPSTIIDNNPLTRIELEDALQGLLPVGDDFRVVSDDTWVLGESGSQGVGEGGLL